ncbi:MAG: ABC transporter substrate-binding protein [Nocardioides sp.]
MRRSLGLMAAAVSIAMLLAGCSGGGSGSSANGGILRIGISTPIDSLNPFVSESDYSSVVYQYVYPHLVEYDANLKLAPSFATSWATSQGGRVWTFHTRPGQEWSDGTPLTAKDAAFTLNMMVKYKNGPTGDLGQLVEGLKKTTTPDDNTLVLHYSHPVANVLAQMQGVHILPPKVWGPLATGNGSKIRTFQNNAVPMVSGGPFTMVKYTVKQTALFQRNPHWYGQKPHIAGFGLQMFGTSDAMVAALKAGDIDMTGEFTPPTVVKALKSAGLVVDTAPSLTFNNFIINTNPKKTSHRELLDPKVREAMEYAIDRAQIIKTAYLGYATPGDSVVAPASGWADPSLKGLPFSLAKANQILDGLGYTKGSNGVRVADGHPMVYNLVFPTEIAGAGDRTFAIIANDFKKIGIVLKENRMDPDAAQTAIEAPKTSYTGFDLAMWDWVLPPDPQNVLGVLTCAQLGNNSDSGYCNPAYDKLFAEQGAVVDQAKRQRIVTRMARMIFDARPYIVIDYPDIIEAHSKKWTGFVMSPLVGSVNNMSTQTLVDVHQVG